MKGYLLSFVVILVCVGSLMAESTGEDLEGLMAEMKILRQEMAEEKRSRDEENTVLREQLAQNAAATKDLEEKLSIVETELQRVEDARPRHSQEEDQIAFSVVSYLDFGPVTVDTNIPFEVVYLNVGEAWQAHINSFMAMRAGVYSFTASIVGHAGSTVVATIAHTTSSGTQNMAMVHSSDLQTTDSDANTVIFPVDVGDYVSVQLWPVDNGSLYSRPSRIHSTFSGFFLFP